MPESSSADVMSASSTDTEIVDTPVDSASANTSPAPSVLDAVEAALKTDGVEAESRSAENRSEEAKTEPNGSDPAKDESEVPEEELKQFSPRAQERIRDLAAQKNDLRGQIETLTGEIEPLKAKAQNFDTLSGYLSENGISAKEANNALEITRLIKTKDYDRALQVMGPMYEELRRLTGGVLDQDLQQDVRLGHLPQARALEIQKSRATSTVNAEREQDRAKREGEQRQQSEQRQQAEFVGSVAQAADDWAKEQADSDPDWNQKQDLVADALAAIIAREGFPKSIAAGLEQSKRALEEVNKRVSRFQPKPKPIARQPQPGNASPSQPQAPKSALEAINLALGD